ncbi:20205_t:CDS:2 [Funneliformis geosporum]|nr:20205_t:CDS:2 [Funneliformis geosporum]
MNPTTIVAKPSTVSVGATEQPSKDGTGASFVISPKYTEDKKLNSYLT